MNIHKLLNILRLLPLYAGSRLLPADKYLLKSTYQAARRISHPLFDNIHQLAHTLFNEVLREMRKGILIALSLLRIRRLFLTLILFPLLLSLVIVALQSLASTAVISALDKKEGKIENPTESPDALLRPILFGKELPPEKPLICRWQKSSDETDRGDYPPSEACDPDRMDAALIVSDPETFDPKEYVTLLAGNVSRIHLCKTCAPDLIFYPEAEPRKMEMRSIWASLILHLTTRNESVLSAYKSVRDSTKNVSDVVGTKYLSLAGFQQAINLSDVRSPLLFIFNFAALIVVALWLALKAHRRILDYFSQNGALLPMVAANGKQSFYLALWLITLARVAAFLFSAIPLTLFSIHEFILTDNTVSILTSSPLAAFSWGIALIVSLTLATLIASIADLHHRTNLLSICYRFLPLLIAGIGAFIWSATFLFDSTLALNIRDLVCAVPILGMAPIFLSLIFQSSPIALIIHALGSLVLIVILMRSNATWFGAHLEEI